MIEVTNITNQGTYIEVNFVHTLQIPDKFKNDAQLMSKAGHIIHNFNANNYVLQYVVIDSLPYIQSFRTASFNLPTTKEEIWQYMIDDCAVAQAILDYAEVPDFYRAVNTIFDGSTWRDAE